MEDYFKQLNEYPPLFTDINWNGTTSATDPSAFMPFEYEQKAPPSFQHQPFQRRRSSSVDLPINPLYANTNRYMYNSNESTIQEEGYFQAQNPFTMKTGFSATLEFPSNTTTYNNYSGNHYANQATEPQQSQAQDHYNQAPQLTSQQQRPADSPCSFTSSSSTNNDDCFVSATPANTTNLIHQQANQQANKVLQQQQQQQQQQQTTTFFPELHRTSYNTMLSTKLKHHQKRRRSSSLPPAFHQTHKQRTPTPLIFTQIQVTDPTPIQHTQKVAKVDARPVPIERAPKKQPPPPTITDPITTQNKLNDELLKVNFEDVTVAELKEMLRERGLAVTGKKALLVDRLKEARDQLLGITKSGHPDSPAIQELANMTIHSPAPPPNQTLFYPIVKDNVHPNELVSTAAVATVVPQIPSAFVQDSPSTNTTISTFNDNSSFNYQYDDTELLDINDLFNFDTLDNNNNSGNAYYSSHRSNSMDQPIFDWQNDSNNNNSDWDQDKLDIFLTELV